MVFNNILAGSVAMSRRKVIPHRFQKLTKHPTIAAMSTVGGRTIAFLEPYRGTMITGYGDWTNNTGPTDVLGYNLNSFEPVTLFEDAPTEAFHRIRILDGRAYLPWTDPRIGHTGGFTTDRRGVWENVFMPADSMIHTFDVTMVRGRILVCGSVLSGVTGQGCVWAEVDGEWVKVLQDGTPDDFARFYAFFTHPETGLLSVTSSVGQTVKDTFSTADGINWHRATYYNPSSNTWADLIKSQNSVGIKFPTQGVPEPNRKWAVHNNRFWTVLGEDVYVSEEIKR